MDFLHRMLASAEYAIAGLFGALVSVPFHEELKTWKGRVFFVGSGSTCAYFTTPLAIAHYTIEPALAGGFGFLLGAFGGSLIAAGIRSFKTMDLVELIKSKMGW